MTVTQDYAAFDPRAYLEEYYADIGAENRALLRFLVAAFQSVPAGARVLDFGGGPTLYGSIVAAARAAEIHFADYSPANLAEVGRWLAQDPAAFDWTPFVAAVLELEGSPPTPQGVARRQAELRERLTRLLPCDCQHPCPLGDPALSYDVVMTNFCAEAAAHDLSEWRQCMGHIASLLRPGGRLILSAIKGARSYGVGETTFFAVSLHESDLDTMLTELGFVADSVQIETEPADRASRLYEGLMFVTALKKSNGG